jgi:pyruvate carboxylase subunit B
MEQYPKAQPVQAPVKGKLMWQYDVADVSTAPVVGTAVKKGDILCYVQAYYGVEEVRALADGKIVQIEAKQGEDVQKDQVLAFIA